MSENNNEKPVNETATTTTTEEVATATTETPSTNTSEKVEVKNDPNTSALADLGLKGEVEEKATEEKTEEVKAPEVKKEESAPAEYELELKEGSVLTEKDLDEVVELAEKYKWSKEDAEKYIAKKEEIHNRGVESLRTKAHEIIQKEKEKFLADPDFQGAKLKDSLGTIDLVVSKYGDKDLADYLKGPGGNSLPLAKMLLRLGNIMKQDTFNGKGTSASVKSEGTVEGALKTMYPNFFVEK